MTDSSQNWAAPHSHGGTAMLDHRTAFAPVITPEFDQACETFASRREWMLAQGWEGQFVAISGANILGHGEKKRPLAQMFAKLAAEKKLLVREVTAMDFAYPIELT
jgi:hypothetical protein